jgi:membrane protein implicated in regulation of membrane protease activity
MSFGETIVRWAIIIAFGLLAFVTGLAAVLLLQTGQPGNPTVLLTISVVSAAVALWMHRALGRLRAEKN